MAHRRFRIRFRKESDLRFISHLDLARVWERLLRRSGLRVVMTAGFHPRAKINFPSALPLLEMARAEIAEVDLDSEESLEEVERAINRHAPAGLSVMSTEEVSPWQRAAQVREMEYEASITPGREDDVRQRVAMLLAGEALLVERSQGAMLNLRHLLLDARVEDQILRFRLHVSRETNLRARDVLRALAIEDSREMVLTRTSVELE